MYFNWATYCNSISTLQVVVAVVVRSLLGFSFGNEEAARTFYSIISDLSSDRSEEVTPCWTYPRRHQTRRNPSEAEWSPSFPTHLPTHSPSILTSELHLSNRHHQKSSWLSLILQSCAEESWRSLRFQVHVVSCTWEEWTGQRRKECWGGRMTITLRSSQIKLSLSTISNSLRGRRNFILYSRKPHEYLWIPCYL